MGEEAKEGLPLRERYHAVLVEVAKGIEEVLVDEGIELGEGEDRGTIEVDEFYPNVTSRGLRPRGFYFDGGLVPADCLPGQSASKGSIPTVKNIRIPEDLRKKGLGTRLVDVWERVFQKHGFRVFAATNTKGEQGIRFWEKRGYIIPPSEIKKKDPYYMIKEENR